MSLQKTHLIHCAQETENAAQTERRVVCRKAFEIWLGVSHAWTSSVQHSVLSGAYTYTHGKLGST